MSLRVLLALIILVARSASAEPDRPVVKTVRAPNGGIQPQLAIGKSEAVHMLYYKGDATPARSLHRTQACAPLRRSLDAAA